jgi:hypothetical protein
MAGTVTVTESRAQGVKKIKFSWTADASGVVSGTSTTYAYDGELVYYAAVPGTSDDQPTDNYDVTVLDSDSLDVLNALGTNMSNAATTYKDRFDGLGAVANSKLQLTVSTAGASNKGTVYVLIR